MAEYQELSVDGVCEQETTQGYNKLDISNGNQSKNLGTGATFVTDDEKQTLTINGTVTNSTNSNTGAYTKIFTVPAGTYNFIIEVESGSMVSNGGYIRRFSPATLVKSDNTILCDFGFENIRALTKGDTLKLTKTITEEGTLRANNQLIIYADDGTSNGDLIFNNLVLKMYLGESDTYEPYTGGQPSPSPDYPQEIKTIENSLKITSCNKNLFDKDNSILMNKYYTSNGNIQDSENTFIQESYIEVEPNTNYTFSASFVIDYFRMVEYDESKNFIERKIVSNPVLKVTYTTTNNTKYIRVSCSNNNLDTLQIEKGTQETPYEQHLKTQIEANLPEGEFIGKIDDTYKDTLKVEYNEEDGQYHLVLNKKIRKLTISSNLTTITCEKSTNTNTFEFKMWSIGALELGNLPYTKCNYYASKTSYNENCIWNIYNGEVRIYQIFDDAFTSDMTNTEALAKFHELYDDKLYFYYPLQTPYVVDLGIVDMPITYNEVTNLFTDSDLLPTINAKYYRNFISTIQNLQVNEKELKQELADINTRLSALENATTNVTSESEVTE